MQWEWISMHCNGTVPGNAVRLYSNEGKQSYVGRPKARKGFGRYPGELVVENGNPNKYFHSNYDGQDRKIEDVFEVLIAAPGSYYWSPHEDCENFDKACKCIFYIARMPADKYGHRGGFAIKSGNATTFHCSGMRDSTKFEMLMTAPVNLLTGTENEKIHEIFGWTEWNDKLNLQYVVSAGRIKDGDDSVLVARTILDDGKYSYGGLNFDHKTKSVRPQFGPEIKSDRLRVDVLLATPEHYFWTKPPVPLYPQHDTVPFCTIEGGTLTGNRDYCCVARAIYRGQPCVGAMQYGRCHVRVIGPGYYSKEYEVLVAQRPGRSLQSEYLGWAPYHSGMPLDLLAKINYDRSPDACLVISRMLLPRDEGHSFEQHENLGNLTAKNAEVLVCKLPSNLSWISDHSGYVPYDAVRAGQNRDQESVHIGRYEQNNKIVLGLVVPSSKVCASISSSGGHSGSYEVLIHSVDDKESHQIEAGAKNTKPTQAQRLLHEMKCLQNKYFHDPYHTAEFHEKLLQLQYRYGQDLFVNTEEWIPFVSRLARVHGLPRSFMQIMYKFLQGPCTSKRNPKYRVACMILSCSRNGFMHLPGNNSVSKGIHPLDFMPLLKYFSTVRDEQLQGMGALLEVILEAVFVLLKSSKSIVDVGKLEFSREFRDLLICCAGKVSPNLKKKILNVLPNQLVHEPAPASSEKKEPNQESLKLKSLARGQNGRPDQPVPDTTLTTRMHITAYEETLTEEGDMKLADCNALYHSSATTHTEQDHQYVLEIGEITELLQNDTTSFEEVSRLRSFMQSDLSRPLEPNNLRLILKLLKTKSKLPLNTCREYLWTTVASLSKYGNKPSQNLQPIPSTEVHTLLTLAKECSLTKDNNLVLGILTSLVHATGNFQLDASNVALLLKLHDGLDKECGKHELMVQACLRLLHDNIDSENVHPSVMKLMAAYLICDNSKTIRIQSAGLFYRLTVELGQPGYPDH